MIAEFYFRKTICTCMHSNYPVHAHPRVCLIIPISLLLTLMGCLTIIFQMIKMSISAVKEELSITSIPTWKKPMELSTLVMKTVQGKINEADNEGLVFPYIIFTV